MDDREFFTGLAILANGISASALVEGGADYRLSDPDALLSPLEACEKCRQNDQE